LQVTDNQYIFADIYQREKDRNHWLHRVVLLKVTDYLLINGKSETY